MVVFTLAEHFLRDAYQVFMGIPTIISGAGGVAEDYFGLIMKLLLRDIWRILLMLIPVVTIYLIGQRKFVESLSFSGVKM